MSKPGSTQEYKSQLNIALGQIESELKAEIGISKASGKRILKRTAMIAGGGILAYSIISLLTKQKKKSELIPAHYQSTSIGSRVKSMVLVLLLELVKRQLIDIIKNKSNDHRPSE